jgi:hypothetical protein
VENLRDYAVLSDSGDFVVQAKLYTDLPNEATLLARAASVNQSAAALTSNRLILNVRPPAIIGRDGLPVAMDTETNAALERQDLAPDEMISYMLSARQQNQWEKFFLYMDIESMVKGDENRKRQWNAESEEGRQRMSARYRQELQGKSLEMEDRYKRELSSAAPAGNSAYNQSTFADMDIVRTPIKFEIQRVNYGKDEGSVTVLEWFQAGVYVEKKLYTYTIGRKNDTWVVTGYIVQNVTTE